MSWWVFASACGWGVPDNKLNPPQQRLQTLGAMTDLRGFPSAPIVSTSSTDRVESTLSDSRRILIMRVAPALAGKLYGKLMFMSSQYFGRLGRALLRAFSRRLHEDRST